MANYPAEGDRIMLTVRIATPPFKPKPEVGFMDVNPGIASSYIFTLKPGDKVLMSGPYGDFHPIFDSKAEMMWIGGGSRHGLLRSQIMHMTKTLHCTDRVMNYFYGAAPSTKSSISTISSPLRKNSPISNSTSRSTVPTPSPTKSAWPILPASSTRLSTTHTSKTIPIPRISSTTCAAQAQ